MRQRACVARSSVHSTYDVGPAKKTFDRFDITTRNNANRKRSYCQPRPSLKKCNSPNTTAPLKTMAFSQTSTQENESYNREEDYIAARRSAVEAVMVGRETLESAVRQGEQLRNAENLADETEYKLDRATRLLKGMTWSGWLANKFTKDVEPPTYKTAGSDPDPWPPKVYESVPESCTSAAQAVQNYHANLQVLETCETGEQKTTCKLICDNMFAQAKKEIGALNEADFDDAGTMPSRLQRDLNTLRRRQMKSQRETRGLTLASTVEDGEKAALFEGAKTQPVQESPSSIISAQQEDHLDFMAQHLDELGSLASTLNESLGSQSATLDALDEKSESMLFKSNMVTRRTDRLIQKKVSFYSKEQLIHVDDRNAQLCFVLILDME